ncbi:MAG: LptF/LptG family permease [Bryobacteraceae bacterium]|nr:LptF/LptG family permease [Bryobacteraceae bacterium]
MAILSRKVFSEIAYSASLGTALFLFVLFLQKLGKPFEILVRSSASAPKAAYLFALILPPTLMFAVPVGALVGVLLAMSRMSSDGEIIAMRSGGLPSRRLLLPVAAFGLIATMVTAASTLWLTPRSIAETYRTINQLLAEQLTAEIKPRVFEESFPNRVFYVGDVIPGPVVRWRNVFMADLTPAEERSTAGAERGDQPRITTAREAIATPDLVNNRIQLSMLDGFSHEPGRNPSAYFSTMFPKGEQVLEAKAPDREVAKAFTSMNTPQLMVEARHSLEARIELHQRLALPFACILLALVGVPLGVSTRKAGRSGAFVLTVSIAFLYYMSMISLIGMAKQGRIPVELAVWTPNAALALAAIVLIARLERPGDRDPVGELQTWLRAAYHRVRGALPMAPAGGGGGRRLIPVLPQIVDTYVLSSFLFYFAMLLASAVALTHVFTFFELLSDVVKNGIPMSRVLTYHIFLTPKLIYDSAPVIVLVAVLFTFGVLTKHNEVTAMKACGVSLYRLSAPVLVASVVLSAALFGFEHYYVPEANRIQDAIRNEIKGRPVQTYLRPDRRWIFGAGSRIYYYRYFDAAGQMMYGVSVYELEPRTFQLRRHISAERARWEASLGAWVFQNGWSRTLAGDRRSDFTDFTGETRTFPELTETPGYFLKEVKQDQQMNFSELESYIQELQQSGFDTARLRVQFHKKFSVPLFALIMALIAVPFAFLTGGRGAMAGVGVSFGIAVAYWAVSQVFEQVGNLSQLPAAMAAWSPGAIFSLIGMYLFTKMRT